MGQKGPFPHQGASIPTPQGRGLLGGEMQTSGLPWLSAVKTFALGDGQGVMRAGCGLCQRTPSQRSAESLVSLRVVRRCLLCFSRLEVWGGTPVPAGSPPGRCLQRSLQMPPSEDQAASAAGSPGLALRGGHPSLVTPAPWLPPRTAPLPSADEVSAEWGRGWALRDAAHQSCRQSRGT